MQIELDKMANGCVQEKLADKMSGLGVNGQSVSPESKGMVEAMKAVEAANAKIKKQADENNKLRDELQRKRQELDKYRLEETVPERHGNDTTWYQKPHETQENHYPIPCLGYLGEQTKGMNIISPNDPSGMLVFPRDQKASSEGSGIYRYDESQSEGRKISEMLREYPGNQRFHDMPWTSPPSATSFSPKRYQMGDCDRQSNISGHRLMSMAETNTSHDLRKQDLVLKIRGQEEEIMQLRKQISEYSIKEAQIHNEKYLLEKRISYMRLAFDQQQQDLVDAASKALSYRQDIVEENIRLTYTLQAAQQERTTFVSTFVALLAEYSLQPPVLDAQSIVSSIKVLIKHLQEKLMLTESKLKELQYQLAPWASDANRPNMVLQSPSHFSGATLTTLNKRGLELVSQPRYSHGLMPVSSEAQTTANWDSQSDFGADVPKNLEQDELARYSPLASRNSAGRGTSTQLDITQFEEYAAQYSEQPTNKQVMFRDTVSSSEMGDSDIDGNQNDQETPSNWAPGGSPYSNTLEDPSSYSPYLPPVPEDPSSSYSEAADDDPLPGIEGLQISGDPFPGRELQACGYSVNGMTSCNFEWVRHLEDGSVNYIDGAKQPNYLVTADDVNAYLAIEVQPLDNRKRKGELVKVFANEHRKITCDLEMQSHIEKNLHNGQISYKVSLPTGYLDIWEPATLAIKRDAYSIKCSGSSGVVVTEKFTRTTAVNIPYGHPTEFSIVGSDGEERLLRADNSSDISCLRDTIVVTLRLFIMRGCGEERKEEKAILSLLRSGVW